MAEFYTEWSGVRVPVLHVLGLPVQAAGGLLTGKGQAAQIQIMTMFLIETPDGRYQWVSAGECKPAKPSISKLFPKG